MELGFNQGFQERYTIKYPSEIVESIKYIFKKIKYTDGKKYYLIIDGLDYMVRYGKDNVSYISDLIESAKSINSFFANLCIEAKVIILLREELIRIIPNPNLTKRINDNGVSLKWYDNLRDPFNTSLLEIIEKRARLAGCKGTILELWDSWFDMTVPPEKIHFILDNTRYLPRDLISFFRELQKIKSTTPFSWNNVLAALANYSEWFHDELKDSLVGIMDEDIRNNISSILSTLGKEFTEDDFNKLKIKICPDVTESSGKILQTLFDTSWIGNVWNDNGKRRFSWKHRKRQAQYRSQYKICIHKGLYKSLNLI